MAQLIDGAAMQEAEYAISPNTGGRLQIPIGCYVSGTTHIVRAISTVSGDPGVGGSVYTYPSHNFNVFQNDAAIVTYSDIAFNPGGGFGNGYPVGVPTGSTPVYAIYDPYVAGVAASAHYNMTAKNIYGTNLWSGIFSGGGNDIMDHIFLSFFTGPTGSAGIQFDAPYVDGKMISNSGIYGATYGVLEFGQASTIEMVNVELPGNGTCLLISPPAGGHVVSVTLNHVWCDSGTVSGAVIDGSATGAYVARVRINDSWFSSNHTNGLLAKGNVTGVSVTGGSEFYANLGDGITLDSTLGTTKGFSIDTAKIAGNGNAGVNVGAGVSGWSVTNSNIGPNADFGANAYPIYVGAGAGDYYRILGNDMHGNTNAMSNGATGTHTAVANNLQ